MAFQGKLCKSCLSRVSRLSSRNFGIFSGERFASRIVPDRNVDLWHLEPVVDQIAVHDRFLQLVEFFFAFLLVFANFLSFLQNAQSGCSTLSTWTFKWAPGNLFQEWNKFFIDSRLINHPRPTPTP